MPDGLPISLAPKVDDVAPADGEITRYDQEHFITYARLLDAEGEDADWREVVRIVLGRNPDESVRSLRCWRSHLARARWIATAGYQQLVARAAANQT